MDKPQIGDIWTYTFKAEAYIGSYHLLVLDIINDMESIYLCRSLEHGWTSQLIMQNSRNMQYTKIA